MQRLSSFHVLVEVAGKIDTIDNHFQMAKRFLNDPEPTTPEEGKLIASPTHFVVGRKTYYTPQMAEEEGKSIWLFHFSLWHRYLSDHPETVAEVKAQWERYVREEWLPEFRKKATGKKRPTYPWVEALQFVEKPEAPDADGADSAVPVNDEPSPEDEKARRIETERKRLRAQYGNFNPLVREMLFRLASEGPELASLVGKMKPEEAPVDCLIFLVRQGCLVRDAHAIARYLESYADNPKKQPSFTLPKRK